MSARFGWERVSSQLWTSDVGYVEQTSNLWTAYAYRNMTVGQFWKESKTGFDSAAAAMAWVENHAEL